MFAVEGAIWRAKIVSPLGLAISAHLMTEAEIDEFVDDALAELEEIRITAKKALAAANSN